MKVITHRYEHVLVKETHEISFPYYFIDGDEHTTRYGKVIDKDTSIIISIRDTYHEDVEFTIYRGDPTDVCVMCYYKENKATADDYKKGLELLEKFMKID